MNKLILTFAALAASYVATAQSLYSTDFSTEEEFNKWTVIDANNDEATWKFDAEGTQSKVYYPYSATNVADDWLISPEITPSATGRVMVKYTTYGTSYGESMEVLTGNVPTAEGMNELQAMYDGIKNNYTTNYFFMDITKDTPFRVAFHCTSGADHWKFYISAFSVQMVDKVVDLQADSLLSPVRGYNLSNAETVTARVVNNGLDASGNFEMAYQIDGGEIVKETVEASLAPEETMVYTFKTKADLSETRHNYNIKVFPIVADDVNHENDTLVSVVRCDGAITPPCSWGFELSEDNAQLKYYNLNEDDGDWEVYTSAFMNMARTGNSCLAYNYNKDNNADDWAMLDPVNVEAGNYVLRYWYSGSDGHTEKLGVYYGNGDTPADMKTKVDEQIVTQGRYQEAFKVISFDKPQTVYFGFYAFSDKDENWLTIDDVQFYKASSDEADLGINNISKPFDYVRAPYDKNVEFELQNVGVKDTEGKAVVSVDGTVKKELAISLKAQEIKGFVAEDVLTGLDRGEHKITITVESADDKMADNNVMEKEIVTLGEPTILYDFEGGQIPEGFRFYVGDEGTINPDAGEEFNEAGWGIFNIDNHAMLGQHLLAGTSWIDGATPDRWVILPQVKVTDENAYFAWDANSFNQYGYLEDYSVKVSDGSGNPADWWYSTEVKVEGETITPKTRGFSLSKYKDKEIFIAFNIVSKKGEALCLDNLGIYGGAEICTGIDNVNGNANGILVIDNNSVAAAGAKAISIVDMSGRIVLVADGEKADVTSLQPGVYAANVKYDNALSRAVKFVKK